MERLLGARAGLLGLVLISVLALPGVAKTASDDGVALKLLVISADGKEADLPAIRQTLDYLGTPYTTYVAAATPGGLTPEMLASAGTGKYEGVILATSSLGFADRPGKASALTSQEWSSLRDYETRFAVREVAWYAFPNAELGFESPVTPVSPSANAPLKADFTTAGGSVWGNYANTATPLSIQDAYV
jgi:hypothetical protein